MYNTLSLRKTFMGGFLEHCVLPIQSLQLVNSRRLLPHLQPCSCSCFNGINHGHQCIYLWNHSQPVVTHWHSYTLQAI
ncbi:hypothetical protein RchiOBHm_Chr3g0496691 [Rosa chinensis]|uniref:Uncharacterized protein n=1 Tax=Rosa chinensis TaxID=74649 RepID=A0A2P6RHJ0_ROSCH|nr:hypothetical protein RchiOBHm_Chr3g0496691 [Rosa chinensis]